MLSGIAIAGQASINGRLSGHLGDPMLASVVSFGGGLVLLVVLTTIIPRMREGLGRILQAIATGRLRRWHLFGGIGGASLVACQATTVGTLGVAMFTVGVVAGQTVSGLVVDKVGLGPAGVRPLSGVRVVGAGMMLVAVVLATWGGLSAVDGAGALLVVLPLLSGLAVAVQQAINGKVGAAADNPLTATLVNFLVGTIALVVGWLLSMVIRGTGDGQFPANPVLYLGGLVGVLFIAIAAVVVRLIGVLVLGLATIAGQLVGSVLLDLVVPTHPGGLSVVTLFGVGLALVAIVIAAAPSRPGRARRRRTRDGGSWATTTGNSGA